MTKQEYKDRMAVYKLSYERGGITKEQYAACLADLDRRYLLGGQS